MSDISDLEGVFPTSIRWNAKDGFLGIAAFNQETGERGIEEVALGQPATFAMDLLTRSRGYGLVKVGIFDMRLTPVGSPPPPWPGDGEEFKAAIGAWLWCPQYGEVRLETNASIFRQAVVNIWDKCRFEPLAAEGQQPVVRFTDRVLVSIKSVGEEFWSPVIKIVGWVPRSQVPNWEERTPTVMTPAALPTLPAAPTPAAPIASPADKRRHKAKQRAAKPGPDDSLDGVFGGLR